MELRNHADTQIVKRQKGYAIYIHTVLKFRKLQMRENGIALRKLSGGREHTGV